MDETDLSRAELLDMWNHGDPVNVSTMPRVHYNGVPYSPIDVTVTSSMLTCLCPDLLRFEQIGEADGARGRVVRAFFWLMRYWPPRSR